MSTEIKAADICSEYCQSDEIIAFGALTETRVDFGSGAVSSLADHVKSLGGSKVLLVTDPGIAEAGHMEWVMMILINAGIDVLTYTDVRENPTTEDVSSCVDKAQGQSIDLIVGLGGGSSLDTAKGCNFILTNGGEMKDYWGSGKADNEMLPFIAIPTTAGTGSECQSYAIIADSETHIKMACGDKKAAARIAILDPELTVTQPSKVTSHTGIDALSHAIETCVTTKRNDVSYQYSKLAFNLLNESFESVLKDPKDIEARSKMILGAAYAGTAIESSMLGAAHAAANPLTAQFGIIHGAAVGMMLPHVIRYNSEDSGIKNIYTDLYDGDLSNRVNDLLDIAGISSELSSYGVDRGNFLTLSKDASSQWTGTFNPRTVGVDEFADLYESAF
ncbi:MAG TPA: iron-containing alcohol dehydrogenase [Verrucomicrobia bacterium]|nr:iron-containing alcohol dehydrogenase [Verrucomicrobiales bacterium]HIL55039.1 iron-containing alcohol dehydrogenase [Verrucomicrobiota bacterium]